MCVLPIPQPYARAEEVMYSQTRQLFQKISKHSSSVIFTEYFDLKTQVFDLLIANYK